MGAHGSDVEASDVKDTDVVASSPLDRALVGGSQGGSARAREGIVNGRAFRAVKGGLLSTGSGDEERAWAADKRDFVADRRDGVADERDRVADSRDRTADDREAGAQRVGTAVGRPPRSLAFPLSLERLHSGPRPCRTVAGATEPRRGAGETDDSSCRSG